MIEDRIISGEALTAYLTAKPYLAMENIPYADDVVGKYAVPGWGALSKQIEDPLTPPESIAQLRQDRAKIFMSAVHHSDVHLGPVREREEVTPEPDPTPEPDGENPNEWRIVRAVKKLGGNLKKQWNNFTPFAKENKLAAATGVMLGFTAGLGIVTGVHASTEMIFKVFEMVGMSNNTLHWMLGIPMNIAGSWYLNREFISKVRTKWAAGMANENFRKKNNLSDEAVLTEQEQTNLNLDIEGMFASIVIGDIGGKIAGSMVPITVMLDRVGDSLHAVREFLTSHNHAGIEVPQASLATPATPAEIVPPHTGGEGVVPPGSGEPVDLQPGDLHPLELPVDTHGAEHIVQGNDEMLTQILVDHGLKPYSGDYIRLLSENKDVFAEMLQKVYPDGKVPVLVDLATNHSDYISVEQAVKNLNEVIEAGYPDPNALSEPAYRAALTKMFNAVRYLLPGTEIEIPTP